ncbi:MAG: hypothetical protein ACLP3R_03075 [Candidatus Korobacteraceae bacterium]
MVKLENRRALRPAFFFFCAIVATGALLVLRRPDAVFHAQFWAEDGVVWYADSYNRGALRALSFVSNGYLTIFPRLIAAAAQLLPLVFAPLLFNLVALFIEALPPLFLVSSRMRNVGPQWLRCMLALLYLLVPDSGEVHANITNSQWHLVVLACLILVAEVPRSTWGRIFDVVMLLLCGLSTATVFPLLAVAVARDLLPLLHYRGKKFSISPPEKRWGLVQTSLLAVAAFVQGLTLLTAGSARLHSSSGATVDRFVRIAAGQIVLPVFLGGNRLDEISHDPTTVTFIALMITAVTGLVYLYALVDGTPQLKCFILLAGLVLTAALTFPNVQPVAHQWDLFLGPGAALRYWYIPKLALMATLIWLLGRQRPVAIRLAAGVLTCTMLVALVTHWPYRPFDNFQFGSYVRTFEQLPSGAVGEFPLNPAGIWTMRLVKK